MRDLHGYAHESIQRNKECGWKKKGVWGRDVVFVVLVVPFVGVGTEQKWKEKRKRR